MKNKSLMFLVSFFYVICKISNFDTWTAKHLGQASCTELTLPESVIRPNHGKMYQCAVRERENWCPFVWWCHENDVPRLGSWRLSSFDLLGRADQPTTAIPMPFMLRPPKWQAKQTCQIPIRGTTMNFSQARPRLLEGYFNTFMWKNVQLFKVKFQSKILFCFQIMWPSHNLKAKVLLLLADK